MENNNYEKKPGEEQLENDQKTPQREHMSEIGKDQNIGGGSSSTGSDSGSSTGIEKDTSDGLNDEQ